MSANVDHVARIENLFEEKDFSLKILRDKFQELFADIESRFIQPIDDALTMASMKAEEIDMIVPMGAGTRVPRLKQLFQDYFKGLVLFFNNYCK